MNNICIIIIGLVLVISGCVTSRSIQSGKKTALYYPEQPVVTAKDESWLTVNDMIVRARQYIKQNVHFDLKGTEVTVYVNSRYSQSLMRVVFSHEGIGGDICDVWINRRGEVINCFIGKGIG